MLHRKVAAQRLNALDVLLAEADARGAEKRLPCSEKRVDTAISLVPGNDRQWQITVDEGVGTTFLRFITNASLTPSAPTPEEA